MGGGESKSTERGDECSTKPHEKKLSDEEEERVAAVITQVGREFEYLAQHGKTGVELKAELEKHELVDSTGKLISTPYGNLLLRIACSSGNLSTARVLLEIGASPLGSPSEHMQTLSGSESQVADISCVHLAAAQDNAAVLELLLSTTEFGDLANLVQQYKIRDLRTPLMCVASRYQKYAVHGGIGRHLWTAILFQHFSPK